MMETLNGVCWQILMLIAAAVLLTEITHALGL
jgi:hypothetical protein